MIKGVSHVSGVWGTFRVFPMWEGVWRTFGESLVVVFWGTMRVSHMRGGGGILFGRWFYMCEGAWGVFGVFHVWECGGTIKSVSRMGVGDGEFRGSITLELFGSLWGGRHMLEVFRRLKGCHEWEGVLEVFGGSTNTRRRGAFVRVSCVEAFGDTVWD